MLTNDDYLDVLMNNFGITMFVLAVILIILHKLIVGKKISNDEIVYRWMALLPLGVTSLYMFIVQIFYPEISIIMLGWPQSPYQYQVGFAYLGLGMAAILSFNASFGFRLATVIANTIFLLGCASQHIFRMVMQGNYYHMENISSWLWMNELIVPLIIFICMNSLSRAEKS